MVHKVDCADAGNLESRLVPRRKIESKLSAAADTIAEIRAMLPAKADAIELRVLAGKDDLGLSFRGLLFARWTKQGVFFGLDNSPQRLTSASKPLLARLRHQLDLHRNSLAEDVNHYLYRGAPERWLETIVSEDPTKLDPQLRSTPIFQESK